MANNRMYLIDKRNPKHRICVAKYYPTLTAGWYAVKSTEEIDAWLEVINSAYPRDEIGYTDIEIEYEIIA